MSRNTAALTLTSVSHFINDGNTIVLPVLYTFLVKELGFSNFMVGVTAGVFSAVSAVAAPGVAAMSSRDVSRFMGLGILCWGVGLIALGYSVSSHVTSLVLASVAIAGFSSAFYHPLGAAILSLTFEGRAGTAMGVNGSMGSVGRALYPTITLLLFSLTKAMPTVLYLLGAVSIASSIPSLTSTLGAMVGQGSNSIKERTPMGVVSLLTAISLLRSSFQQGVTQFLPTLLVTYFGFKYDVGLGGVLSATLAAAIVGQPLFGLMSDRFGRRLLFALAGAGSLASFFAFVAYPSLIWLVLFGVFTYSGFPITLSLVGDLVPRNSTGLSNSLVWGVGVSGEERWVRC